MQSSSIRLLVKDFEPCFLFYKDKLQLPVRMGNEMGPYAEFIVGQTTIALFQRDFMANAIGTASKPVSADMQDAFSVILSVDDVDETHAEYIERGVASFLDAPQDFEHWFIRAFHLRDPDGNLIEVNGPMEKKI